MPGFHERETCEGIIQHLERREKLKRREVEVHDQRAQTPLDARVEMTFRLGTQFYAIEHTGIEPFEGHQRLEGRAPQLSTPIVEAIRSSLPIPAGTNFELSIPVSALDGRPTRDVANIQKSLIAWVAATAPTLPPHRYVHRKTFISAQPPGVPFTVGLSRYESHPSVAGTFVLSHVASSDPKKRQERIGRACDRKFPKLHKWKTSHNARTILVLEDNDLFLSNSDIIARTFLPIAQSRIDAPDETYLVDTHTPPTWYAWPMLINGKSYYELGDRQYPLYFELDSSGNLKPVP